MTKVGLKKTAIALLCACAILLASVLALAGGGAFNIPTAKADGKQAATFGSVGYAYENQYVYLKLNVHDSSDTKITGPQKTGYQSKMDDDTDDLFFSKIVANLNNPEPENGKFVGEHTFKELRTLHGHWNMHGFYDGATFLINNNNIYKPVPGDTFTMLKGLVPMQHNTTTDKLEYMDYELTANRTVVYDNDSKVRFLDTNEVWGIKLADSFAVEKDKTVSLNEKVIAAYGANYDLTYESSDTSVATVDEHGVVTGLKGGTATITVHAGDKSASTTLSVAEGVLQSIQMQDGYSITYKKFSMTPTVSGNIVATIKDPNETTRTETVALTADMVTECCDTSAPGEKEVTVSYTESGITQTVTATATVSAEVVDSNISGIKYNDSGAVNNNRNLAFSFKTTDGMKIVNGDWRGRESMVPGKTVGELIEVKYSNQETTTKLSDISGAVITAFGSSVYLEKIDKEGTYIEYVVVRPGFVVYASLTDGGAVSSYFMHTSQDRLSVVTEDLYIGYTSNNKSENYGKVVKPLTNLQIAVADSAKTEYEVGESLDVTGITYTADYVDPAETGSATGNVTAAMCSADMSSEGTKAVTVYVNGATATFDITVSEPAAVLSSVAMKEGYAITYKKFDITPTVSGSIVATFTSRDGDTTEEVALTAEMITARCDTTSSGEKDVTISYTSNSVTKTVTAVATVSTEVVETNVLGGKYNVSGVTDNNSRYLALDYASDKDMKVVVNIHSRPSANPEKTIGDLVEIKFAEESGLKTLTEAGGGLGAWGQKIFIQNIEDKGTIEYVVVRPGFIHYTFTGDTLSGSDVSNYFPAVSNGKLTVVTEDIYLTWTEITAGHYGKVVKPLSAFTVNVAENAKTTYYTGEPALDLTGITYSATYVDPAEQAIGGNVTADMCSAIPDEEGEGVITVSLNGRTTTFAITVVAPEKTITSIALKSGDVVTYKRYAIYPETGCKVVATFTGKDGSTSTEELDLAPSMITARPDTSVAGDKTVTISYKIYGKTVTADVAAKVLSEVVSSNILGIKYGVNNQVALNAQGVGHAGVKFEIVTHGADGLSAIDAIRGLPSVIPGKTLGDLVLIKFTGSAELIPLSDSSLSALNPAFYGGDFALRELGKVKDAYGDVEYVIIKAGFIWYNKEGGNTWGQGNSANTSDYFPVPTNIVTKDLYVGFADNIQVSPVASFTAQLPEGYKTAYMRGEALSVSGVVLKVKYIDPAMEDGTVNLTPAMCGVVTGNLESAQAVITYMGKTYTITGLTLSDDAITAIKVVTAGKTEYSFAIDEFDITGYVINMVVENSQGETREIKIDNADIVVSGYNSHDLGKQTLTFAYGDYTTTQDVTTVDDNPEKRLSVDYISSYSSYEPTRHKGLIVNAGLEGLPAINTKTFYQGEKLPNVADKVKINGVLATELLADGSLDSIRFYTTQIVFMFYTNKLQGSASNSNYVEGVTQLVETITFLPGFQFYTTSEDIWPGTWTMDDIILVKHAVIKEEITLVNINGGMGWMRELKKNEDGTTASDAITIGSLPTRTTFSVGEKVTAANFANGLKLHFKYSDGGEEDVIPGISDIEFDSNLTATAGKKTVTVYFKSDDYYATFEVEVVDGENGGNDDGEKPEEKGCGCGSDIAATSVIVGAACVLCAMLVVAFKKKERKN